MKLLTEWLNKELIFDISWLFGAAGHFPIRATRHTIKANYGYGFILHLLMMAKNT